MCIKQKIAKFIFEKFNRLTYTFGCPYCSGKVRRVGYWKKAQCNKCGEIFDVEGL